MQGILNDCIKAIINLVSLRRDTSRFSKFPQESNEITFLNQIPMFDKSQFNQFSNDIKEKHKMVSTIRKINYQFNKSIMNYFIDTEDPPSEVSLVIIFYQVIARMFCNTVPLSSDDYILIMKVLEKKAFINNTINPDFINYSFYLLVETAHQTKHFVWTKEIIIRTATFFKTNMTLTSNFYALLIQFLTIVFKLEPEDKEGYIKMIFDIIYELFHNSKSKILAQKNFTSLLDIISSYLSVLNYDAVLLLATISKYDNSIVLQKYTQQLPILFVSKIQEKSAQNETKISIRETRQIHNFPAVYQARAPLFDFSYKPCNSNKRISNVPNSLSPIYSKKMVSLISAECKEITSLFIDFLRKANPDLIRPFFVKLNEDLYGCLQSSDGYNVLAPYLFLIDSIGIRTQNGILNEDKIAENLMLFLREPVTNRRAMSDTSSTQQKGQKVSLRKIDFKVLFDPSKTVFGPNMLDQTLNIFRSKFIDIIFTKCQSLILPLLKSADGFPFLMAEIIGRCYYYMETLIPYLCRDDQLMNECFKYVSKQAVNLQTIGSQKAPLDVILLFFGEFLKSEKSFEKCLKSTIYADSFYRFMFDQRYTKVVLTLVYQAMLIVKSPSIADNTAIYLFKSSKCEELADFIFQTVSAAVCHNPLLIPVFESFIDPIMKDFKKDTSSKLSFDNMIQVIAQYANQTSHCVLKSEDFPFICQALHFTTYTLLYNLIMGTHTISKGSIYTIKKTEFLPFLLIAYSNNEYFKNEDNSDLIEALKDLYSLASYSDYNAIALHDGDIDYILLKHLQNNPESEIDSGPKPIQYKGFEFTLDLSKAERKYYVYPLLKLISSKKTDEKIADLMIKTIVEAHDDEILSIVSYNINDNQKIPTPNFPIGTIPNFCEITGLTGSIFNGPMTFTFWLKVDPIFMHRSIAELTIFSATDNNKTNRFEIEIIGGCLYASFSEMKMKTMVCISPRLDYNKWTHFVIEFENKPDDEDGRIYFKTYQGFDRLQDSEFNLIRFNNNNPVTIEFGGFSSTSQNLYMSNSIFGGIAKFSFYSRLIDDKEMVDILLNEPSQPNDAIFTMNDYKTEMYSTTLTRLLNLNNNQTYVVSKYYQNYYQIDSLEKHITSQEISEKIVKSIPLIPRSMIFQYLHLLGQIISKTNNKQLSAICASYLVNMDQDLDYPLFATVYSIVKSIDNKTIQRYWVEDVIANCTLWRKSGNNFQRILFHYGTKMITDFRSSIWETKSYFSYFLNQFNEHCCLKSNSSDIPMFSLFLERIAVLGIDINDIRNLMSFLLTSSDSNKVIYLQMISKMASPIRDDQYAVFPIFLSILDTENIEIVKNALIAMSELYREFNFHRYIIIIMNYVKVDKKLLFDVLNKEETLNQYPNVFPLLCSIALEINQNIKFIPKGVVLSSFWYLFPLLLSLRFEDNVELIDFVAVNSLESNDLDEIVSLTVLLSSYANYKCQYPLNQLLRAMMEFSKDCNNKDSLFKIFFHSLSSFFFHLDAPICHKAFLNFPDYMKTSPPFRNSSDNIKKAQKKIDITNFDDIKRFIQTDFSQKRMRFYLSYNEDKYINWPIGKPMKKKLLDYSLLSEASVIADRLVDDQIPNVVMLDSGSFFKVKKTPQFSISDVKQLIQSIHQMEMKSDDLQEFQKRNYIFKYLIKRMHATITLQGVFKMKNLFLNVNPRRFQTNYSRDLALVENSRIKSMLSKPNFKTRMTRNYNICFAFCPFLLKTVKPNVEIHRYNPKKVEISENAKIILPLRQIPARVTVEVVEIKETDEQPIYKVQLKTNNNNNKQQNQQQQNETQSLSSENKVGSPIRASFSATDFDNTNNDISDELSEENLLSIISPEAKVIRTKKIVKIKTKISKNELDIKSDILNVYYINQNSVLIITNSHEPFLIDFSPNSAIDFISQIESEGRPFRSSIEALYAFIPALQKKWFEYTLSNFKYLNFLNLISGRNYQNTDAYPLFPSPNFLDKVLPPTSFGYGRRSSESSPKSKLSSELLIAKKVASDAKGNLEKRQKVEAAPKMKIQAANQQQQQKENKVEEKTKNQENEVKKSEETKTQNKEENKAEAKANEAQTNKSDSKLNEKQANKPDTKPNEAQANKPDSNEVETKPNEKQANKPDTKPNETQANKPDSNEVETKDNELSKSEMTKSDDALTKSQSELGSQAASDVSYSSLDSIVSELSNEKRFSVNSIPLCLDNRDSTGSISLPIPKRLSVGSIGSNHATLSAAPTKSLQSRSPSKGSLAAQFPQIVTFLKNADFGNWNNCSVNETSLKSIRATATSTNTSSVNISISDTKKEAEVGGVSADEGKKESSAENLYLSNSSAFFNEKSRFSLPEIYFMYDSIDENVYEYRKKLESSHNINKWVSIVFGRDKRIITENLHRRLFSTPIPDRPPRPPINMNLQQQIDIINDSIEGKIHIKDGITSARVQVPKPNKTTSTSNPTSNSTSTANSSGVVGSFLKNFINRGGESSQSESSSGPKKLSSYTVNLQVVFATSAYFDNGFIIVLETGEIRIIQVAYNKELKKMYLKSAPLKEKIENPTDPMKHYFYFNTGVVLGLTTSTTESITFGIIVYDERQNTLDLITNRRATRYEKVFIEKPIFSGSVYFSTPSTIDFISRFLVDHENNKKDEVSDEQSSNPLAFYLSQKVMEPPHLYSAKCNVSCFVCSEVFPIFVIGGDDGKIRIRSLAEGKKINTVDLGLEIPSKIIITECWGLILVKTVKKLFVLSMNGKIIKVVENFPDFSQWFTFHTFDDFDFVVMKDEQNKIVYFEAMFPEKMKVFIDFSAKVKVIKYDPYRSCFLILTNDCRLFCFPCDVHVENDNNNNNNSS